MTFLAVAVAWTFFRATSFSAATRMLEGMSGVNGWALPTEWREYFDHFFGSRNPFSFNDLTAFAGARQVVWIGALLTIAWAFPNSQEIMEKMSRLRSIDLGARARLGWSALGALCIGVFLLAAINGSRGFSEFIYFNF